MKKGILYKILRGIMKPDIDEYEERICSLEENVRSLNAHLESYDSLVENVQNLNTQLEGYVSLAENVRNLNTQLEGYPQVITNLRNNNDAIAFLESRVEMQKAKLSLLEKKTKQTTNTVSAENKGESTQTDLQQNQDKYSGIDYFDFENYFRGSKQEIKKRQEIYIPYFKGHNNVLDLGCGRGEFLELLKENEIDAYGVDLYEEFVELCKMQGLKAVKEDAVRAVKQSEHLGGIFAGQLIEHLDLNNIVELCECAYDKLDEGSYMIMETPNPTSLAIYTHAFYMDPSHQKPVHPLTMKYILEKAGFKDVEILYTKESELPIRIPELKSDKIENLADFNEAMQEVQRTLFGSQDYAVVAKK